MSEPKPNALFVSPAGKLYTDHTICSSIMNGDACPYAEAGHMPALRPLDPRDPLYTPAMGEPGDLCPPCVRQHLLSLGHWQNQLGRPFPEPLLPLRLFKCRQWLWLVVPGLLHAAPQVLQGDEATQATKPAEEARAPDGGA